MQISTGHLVNLATSDVDRFLWGGMFFHYLWAGPLESLVVLYFGLSSVGVSFLAGFDVLLLVIPMQVNDLLLVVHRDSKKSDSRNTLGDVAVFGMIASSALDTRRLSVNVHCRSTYYINHRRSKL